MTVSGSNSICLTLAFVLICAYSAKARLQGILFSIRATRDSRMRVASLPPNTLEAKSKASESQQKCLIVWKRARIVLPLLKKESFSRIV